MKNFTIKMKLIIIFVLIKIIPLLIISYITYTGILKLNDYLDNNTQFLFKQNKEVLINTANQSINDSVKNLDKKSQLSLERLSYEIANNVAQFLYQRDEDLLFLSKLNINQQILDSFYKSKKRNILVHGAYYYDEKKSIWVTDEISVKNDSQKDKKAKLKDNHKEYNFTNPINYKTKNIPIYKEVSYFDLEGNEKYKVSQIDPTLKNISIKKNTYINSETYFLKLKALKKGEIYVSNVIGEYVGSNIIGTLTKEKTTKANIEFEPQKHAYAGKENPLGKKFKGIIRFITPSYKDGVKNGYVSLALDHEHIMQFTDKTNPTSANPKQDISNASDGNYAFMWDYVGRNISHPRDYFIVGYDKDLGKPAIPWLSKDIAEKQKTSKKDMYQFLEEYPIFENQSLSKKPNIAQIKEKGNIALDCRYLNFAPQCQGWMQVTKNGGYGSFVIFWSNVWKLTTAASIPYYTGQYSSTKRGFGFVTIGANVDDFHAAANKTKQNVKKIIEEQTKHIKIAVDKNKSEINIFIKRLINELSIVTTMMILIIIFIALWLSNYISRKIEKLLIGTNEFANNKLEYRIKVTSNDEIGKLEESFNNMASKINFLIKKEKKINETLEEKINEEVLKQRKQEQLLIQQSKLASMGEMIGNIAHQWRQPLNALGLVMQNIKFAHQMQELDDEFMERSVSKVNLLTKNMSKTIDDFRNFFIDNKEKKIFKLNKSIEEAVTLMESVFSYHNIKIIINCDNKDLEIEGYPSEFSQALLNILSNSKDAFLSAKIEDPQIIIYIYQKKSFATIEISDNANGIPIDIIDKIFEPYFTTKHQSQGTGIGLYMTKTIIEKNMLGKVNAKNSKEGVTFTIKIPINLD